MSSSSSSLDHLLPSEQLCYVHCNICDTVLAVSVPCTSYFKTVTVRCGHCTNLLPVNMNMILPSVMNQFHMGHNNFLFSPNSLNLMEESQNDMSLNQMGSTNELMMTHHHLLDQLPIRPPIINKPPEKRQRVPSAYNRFIKDEIQRIKAENPDISHREAFSAAAKNIFTLVSCPITTLSKSPTPDNRKKKTLLRRIKTGF